MEELTHTIELVEELERKETEVFVRDILYALVMPLELHVKESIINNIVTHRNSKHEKSLKLNC